MNYEDGVIFPKLNEYSFLHTERKSTVVFFDTSELRNLYNTGACFNYLRAKGIDFWLLLQYSLESSDISDLCEYMECTDIAGYAPESIEHSVFLIAVETFYLLLYDNFIVHYLGEDFVLDGSKEIRVLGREGNLACITINCL
jgi:hypothetical protein